MSTGWGEADEDDGSAPLLVRDAEGEASVDQDHSDAASGLRHVINNTAHPTAAFFHLFFRVRRPIACARCAPCSPRRRCRRWPCSRTCLARSSSPRSSTPSSCASSSPPWTCGRSRCAPWAPLCRFLPVRSLPRPQNVTGRYLVGMRWWSEDTVAGKGVWGGFRYLAKPVRCRAPNATRPRRSLTLAPHAARARAEPQVSRIRSPHLLGRSIHLPPHLVRPPPNTHARNHHRLTLPALRAGCCSRASPCSPCPSAGCSSTPCA